VSCDLPVPFVMSVVVVVVVVNVAAAGNLTKFI
jgi:hypothetical protein